MTSQKHFWSQAADGYEADFIDPYRADVHNPLLPALERLAGEGARVAADLGCGTGPLLPFLSRNFATVYAVDFAPAMLRRARERCTGLKNIVFLEQRLTALEDLAGRVDVAVAVNSLVMP